MPAFNDCVFPDSEPLAHAEPPTEALCYRSIKAYRSGEYILLIDSSDCVAPLICRGLVAQFVITERGDEILLHGLGPGNIIGLSDRFQKRTVHSYATKAVTDVTISFIVISPSLEEVGGHDALLRQVTRQLGIAERASLCMRGQSAYFRVAVAIRELVRLLSLKEERYIVLPYRIPRWFLASYTALSPETVSRSLTKLRKEGVIAFSKRRLVIASLTKLERVIA